MGTLRNLTGLYRLQGGATGPVKKPASPRLIIIISAKYVCHMFSLLLFRCSVFAALLICALIGYFLLLNRLFMYKRILHQGKVVTSPFSSENPWAGVLRNFSIFQETRHRPPSFPLPGSRSSNPTLPGSLRPMKTQCFCLQVEFLGLARDNGSWAGPSSLSPPSSTFLSHSELVEKTLLTFLTVTLRDGKYSAKNVF